MGICCCKSENFAEEYRFSLPPELTGALEINDKLQKAQHILEGQVIGPESMVVDDEAIYVSVNDAKLLKIVDGKVRATAVYSKNPIFSPNMKRFEAEAICGRPLGIRKLVEGTKKFVLVDAYLGVFIIDFSDELRPKSTQILDASKLIDGFKPNFLNDLDVISEDELIITHSSIRHDCRHFFNLVLEHQGDGRILHLKISTGAVKVLAKNLYFPNGIQLTPDKKSAIFAECSMARIKKLNLETGKIDIFCENLPGLPDNIRGTPRGTFWVGLAATRSKNYPSLLDRLGNWPGVRQFFVNIVPAAYWMKIFVFSKHPHSIIVELDSNGKIIRSLHDVTGKHVGDVSQVTEHNGFLYLGSFADTYIAKVEL